MPKIENPGKYPAIVTSCEFGEAKSGRPYIMFGFSGDAGTITGFVNLPLDSSSDKEKEDKIWTNAMKTLRECFEFNGDFETLSDQAVNKPVSIVVDDEVGDDGSSRLKVKWINPPSSAKAIEDQSTLLKSLSARAARTPKPAPKSDSRPGTTARPPVAQRPPAAIPPRRPVAPPADKIDDVPF